MSDNDVEQPTFSPREFLQTRHPERFSDSVRKEVGKIDRALLEFQLSTLNKRNLELAFEDFAKQLCEKVICPNLLEQTGPVAGGDGKVDTQTFPVSEQSKVLWFVGVNDNANKDRWAFAVSTQVDWKAKCRKDVRKIHSTNRGYKKAFCITNQYAKADQRSDIEDALTSETGIEVTVLDVSWILDQVFKNGYEQLAIDLLSIDVDWSREIEIGANDYSKGLILAELEKKIKIEMDASSLSSCDLDILLEVAVLSKELEKPLQETKNLFLRAIDAAKKFGGFYDQFNAHYQYAWAVYWWFEDVSLLQDELEVCIELAKEIGQSGHWGDIVSLASLYTGHCKRVGADDRIDSLALRKDIEVELKALVEMDERPSNALMARAFMELLELQAFESAEQSEEVFSRLLDIVKDGERLIGFSFQEIYDLVNELDDVFGAVTSYENLLDYLTEQTSKRDGESRAALLWLKRGAKKIESKEPYQAVKLIGKALPGLYKKEMKKDLYAALNLLSEAYRQVELYWASRANLLMAASVVTDDYWKSGEFYAAQVFIYTRLALSELQLGRVNYALSWWQLACVVDAQLEGSVLTEKKSQDFDASLSQCFLNQDLRVLQYFTKLPDLLDEMQLLVSRSMLLHVLGYEDLVEEQYELTVDQSYLDYLVMFRDTDIGVKVPELLDCGARYCSLETLVMGCNIHISFPFRSPLVELAETLLSVIEAFFATAMVDRLFILESRLEIEISADDEEDVEINHEFDATGAVLRVEVLCSSFTSNRLNVDNQGVIQDWLRDFIFEVFAHIARPKDFEGALETMIGEDRVVERSVSFGACFVGLQNIMGNDAVKNIKGMFEGEKYQEFSVTRQEAWDSGFEKINADIKNWNDAKPGASAPPSGSLNEESLTHRDIQVHDLIKVRLWDRVSWKGTGFAIYPNGDLELTLLFDDESGAAAIFKDLHEQLSDNDSENRLQVSVIKNIDKNKPSHYRVCLTESFSSNASKTLQMSGKINTMTPKSSENLNRFLSGFERKESYFLSYAVVKDEQMLPAKNNRVHIRKQHLKVMSEWEIGPNTVEIMAVQKDDDPMIPEGVDDPPILKVLASKAKN